MPTEFDPVRESIRAAHTEAYVPPRFREADLAKVSEQAVRDWAAEPKGVLYLTGPVGTGKTYAAWAVVRATFGSWEEYATHAFSGGSTVDLLNSLMPGQIPDDERGTALDPLVRAMSASLLLLDDLGMHKITDWKEETLFRIVDARYNAMLPTIVTSNLQPNQLAGEIGERTASRLADGFVVVPILGGDRRRAS